MLHKVHSRRSRPQQFSTDDHIVLAFMTASAVVSVAAATVASAAIPTGEPALAARTGSTAYVGPRNLTLRQRR